MERNFHRAMIRLDDDMAQVFLLRELTALRDVYASLVGRSVMSKMPHFMREFMPRAMQQGVTMSEELLRDLKVEGLR